MGKPRMERRVEKREMPDIGLETNKDKRLGLCIRQRNIST